MKPEQIIRYIAWAILLTGLGIVGWSTIRVIHKVTIPCPAVPDVEVTCPYVGFATVEDMNELILQLNECEGRLP